MIASSFAQLGSAANFSLFSVSGAVGNTGISTIAGKVGTNAGAVSGFNSTTTGAIHIADSVAAQCAQDVQSAYVWLQNSVVTNSAHTATFGSGEILNAGVYSIESAASVAGNLILDAQNNAEAVFIFKINGAFNTAAATTIMLANGAKACNVYWVAEGAIAMGASTNMAGTLMAHNGAVSMAAGGVIQGRMFSITGAVSVDAIRASLPLCGDGTLTINQGAKINSTGNVFMVFRNINITNNGTLEQLSGTSTAVISANTNTSLSGVGNTTFGKVDIAVANGYQHTLTSNLNIKKDLTLIRVNWFPMGFLR